MKLKILKSIFAMSLSNGRSLAVQITQFWSLNNQSYLARPTFSNVDPSKITLLRICG